MRCASASTITAMISHGTPPSPVSASSARIIDTTARICRLLGRAVLRRDMRCSFNNYRLPSQSLGSSLQLRIAIHQREHQFTRAGQLPIDGGNAFATPNAHTNLVELDLQ